MSVIIKKVIPSSPADKAGIKAGTRLISIDGEPINDVLDYMFYADDDMGLEFESFLMDKKRGCGNKCVFCFIDQNPHGMRRSVYFKDDDSRLSFLQGNYITLTNLTECDADRIIKMKTPVNVSVHTTNPDLRVKMMNNPNAGESLKKLYRFAEAGVRMNCQLVLCPQINDGGELMRSLNDLSGLEAVESTACVPVGLTRFREGLPKLRPFNKSEAADVIKTIDGYGNVYAADEFYLKAGIEVPEYKYYGDFPQYENGVGMWSHMKYTFKKAECKSNASRMKRKISIVTGVLAYPLIKGLTAAFPDVEVFAVRNDFFGEGVTVSGLLTGGDIIGQLKEKDLGAGLLIGSNTLNADGVFLDDVTPHDIETALNVKVVLVEPDGESLVNAIALHGNK